MSPDALSRHEAGAALPEPDLTDPDNPEWTQEDFARAVGPEQLSDAELAAFPNTRAYVEALRSEGKKSVLLELDADVIDFFQGSGPDWKARVNAKLREALPQA